MKAAPGFTPWAIFCPPTGSGLTQEEGVEEVMGHPAVLRGGRHAGVLLRAAIVRGGCKQSGKLARVKQREWKKRPVDTIEAAPAIAVPGFHPGLFSAAPIRSELSAP
jgi:hypothetical protein